MQSIRLISGYLSSKKSATLFLEQYLRPIYEMVSFGYGYWLNIDTGKSFKFSNSETHEGFISRNYLLFGLDKEDVLKTDEFGDYPNKSFQYNKSLNIINHWVRIRQGVSSKGISEVTLEIPDNLSVQVLRKVQSFIISLQLDKPPVISWETYNRTNGGGSISYFDFLNAKSWNQLKESIVDLPRDSLDPTVFDFGANGDPVLKAKIKQQIETAIGEMEQYFPVTDYFILGSILTTQYSPKSDIDINVMVTEEDAAANNVNDETIGPFLKPRNGALAVGTTHEINYYIKVGKFDFDNADAAYSVEDSQWIKEPVDTTTNVQDYMNKFHSAVSGIDTTMAELRRDIIDLEELQSLSKEEVKELSSLLKTKLDEIEDSVQTLTRAHLDVQELRRSVFKRDLKPDEIKKYGIKNKLPENVIYKLLERYYYFDFIRKLEDIIGEDDELEMDDIDDIVKVGKDLWQ